MFKYLNIFRGWLFQNSNIAQTIAKNTFWLFFGQMASRLLRAAIVIYAARVLGASSWGAFSYALGIATFLTTFSDIGINALITKESSRNPQLKDQYLSTAFFIKIGLVAIFVAGLIFFFPHLTKIEEAAKIMPILIFVFAFDTLRDLGSAISRALEKMQIEAGIQIFTNFIIVALGFILLKFSQTSEALSFAYAVGSGVGLVAILYILRHHFRNLLRHFNWRLIKSIILTAWPFGLMGLMGTLMLNTDIIMLGWMRSPEEVGYYSAAQKIIQLLYVLPALIATSIFPVMARMAKLNAVFVKTMLEKTTAFVALISIPVTIVGMLFAAPIINLLFGSAYAPSILTFQILMLTILIVYPSTLIGNAIFAYDQQKSFIVFVLTAALGNVGFNLLLIPKLGIEGAAISTILTQLITNVLIWKKMKKINNFAIWPQLKKLVIRG